MNMNELFIEGYDLPIALSKKESYELFIKMEQGDELARQKLIEHNVRLVIFEVRKHFSTVEHEKKELVSIGIIGLIKAIDTFDLSKKIEFATYASRCIDNEILMFLRKLKKHKDVDSLDKTIKRDKEGNDFKLEDIIKDDFDIVENYTDNETYKHIRKIVGELPYREQKIIMLHFGFIGGRVYKQDEIAKKLSLSQSYVSRLITKTVRQIGKQLEEIGAIELNSTSQRKKRTKKELKKEVKIEEKGETNMSRNLKTIYEYLSSYTKEQIDEVINNLTDKEKELIRKRYGEDLNNPIKSKLTDEERKEFYNYLIPRIKRALNKHNKPVQIKRFKKTKKKPTEESTQIQEEPIIDFKREQKEETKDEPITKEDYEKMIELLRSPSFSKMLKKHSAKEMMIITLKLGFIDGKCFTTQAISNFLGIEEQEIITITKNILLEYKDMVNNIFDGTIKMVKEKEEEKVFKK